MLAEVHNHGDVGCVVLVGGSSTGKTRACWEAVRYLRRRGGCGTRSTRPARGRCWPNGAVGPRTVVWLNEAQHYLLTPTRRLGERVAAGAAELLATRTGAGAGAGHAVAAVLGHPHHGTHTRASLTRTPRPGTSWTASASASRRLHRPDLEPLRQPQGDPRLAEAVGTPGRPDHPVSGRRTRADGALRRPPPAARALIQRRDGRPPPRAPRGRPAPPAAGGGRAPDTSVTSNGTSWPMTGWNRRSPT